MVVVLTVLLASVRAISARTVTVWTVSVWTTPEGTISVRAIFLFRIVAVLTLLAVAAGILLVLVASLVVAVAAAWYSTVVPLATLVVAVVVVSAVHANCKLKKRVLILKIDYKFLSEFAFKLKISNNGQLQTCIFSDNLSMLVCVL